MKLLKAALCAAMVTSSFVGFPQQSAQAASYITIVRTGTDGNVTQVATTGTATETATTDNSTLTKTARTNTVTQDTTNPEIGITQEKNIPAEPIVVVRRDTSNASKTLGSQDSSTVSNGVKTAKTANVALLSRESHTASTIQAMPDFTVLPIIEQGPFGNIKSVTETMSSDQVALVNKTQILVPLDVYRSTNLNPITTTKQGRYSITLPVPHTGGDMMYAGNPKNGVYQVILPVVTINDKEYIDMARISPVLGVTAQVGKRAVTIRPTVGNVEKPAKQTITTPIAWVFDPLRDTPYTTPLTTNGTSVISPSWFSLAKQGVTVSPGVDATYVDTYKQLGYKVWPLVSNTFNPDFTATVLADHNNWYKAADELVLYALSYGFDGYNLDFENINYGDKAKLTAFVTYLANRLHEYQLTVSVDVTGYSDSPNWSMVYDRAALGKVVDFIMLMAYDETGGGSSVAGPVARYPWVRSNVEQLLTEVPANKIILGVPFYMRTWTVPYTIRSNGTVTEGRAKSKTLSMTDSLAVVEAHAHDIHWDDKAKLFYLAYDDVTERPLAIANSEDTATTNANRPHSDIVVTKAEDTPVAEVTAVKADAALAGNKVVYTEKQGTNPSKAKTTLISGTMTKIWFEDPKSLQYKFELASNLNLAGVAAWRKGFETEAARQLFATMMPETDKAVTNKLSKDVPTAIKVKKEKRS